MITLLGDIEFENMLSNLSLTSVAVGAALIGILVLTALFFQADPKSKAPVFAAIVAVVLAVTVTVAGTAAFTRGISARHNQPTQEEQ